jgi:hypothetical protein
MVTNLLACYATAIVGFIFLVRPFSIILDSFQNEIQQKVVFYLSFFFQTNGERSPLK